MICPQCNTDFPDGMSNVRSGSEVYCCLLCREDARIETLILDSLKEASPIGWWQLPRYMEKRLGYLASMDTVNEALATLRRRGLVE